MSRKLRPSGLGSGIDEDPDYAAAGGMSAACTRGARCSCSRRRRPTCRCMGDALAVLHPLPPRQVAHTSVTAPNEHWRQSLRPTVIATPNNRPASDLGNKPRRVLAGLLFCAAAPIVRVTVR